jgi:hypothetical protein
MNEGRTNRRGKVFRTVSVALALCFWAFAAKAGEIGRYVVGGWTVLINADDTTGAFTNCIATASYRSGIDMHVMVSANFSWDLGFSSANWRLKTGDRISIQYRFDRSRWNGAAAEVLSEMLVRIPMPPDGQIASLFRRSRTMEITDGRDNFYFDLAGTSKLLVSLVDCVQTRLDMERNIASADGSSVSATLPDETELRLEGTRVLSNFLLAANFSGAQLVGPEQAPKSLATPHAVAVLGDVISFAIIVPQPERRAERIATEIAGYVSESCDGEYGGGSTKEMLEGFALVNAFTACQDTAGGNYLQFVVTPRKTSGHYMIGVMSSEPLAAGSNTTTGKPEPITVEELRQAAFRASQ